MFFSEVKPVQDHARVQLWHKALVVFGVGRQFGVLASGRVTAVAIRRLRHVRAHRHALLHVAVFLHGQAHARNRGRAGQFESPGFDPAVEIDEGQDGHVDDKLKHLDHGEHRRAKPETPLASHVGHHLVYLGENRSPENGVRRKLVKRQPYLKHEEPGVRPAQVIYLFTL